MRGDSGKAQTCAGKRIGIRAQQLGETAELREQVFRQRLDVGSRVAGEEDDLDQLIIRQIVGPRRDQPLPQPFPMSIICGRVVLSFGEA